MTALGSVAAATPVAEVIPDFRDLMKLWPTGVSVVTTRVDGVRYGFTANSFASVSMDPPMISVCVDRAARCAAAFTAADRLSVNILAAHQDRLASRFASKLDDKFDGLTVIDGFGEAPVLPEALGVLGCRLDRVIPAGDHLILLARVHEVGRPGAAEPLVYHRSRFADVRPREQVR
ncbi:flavin reductase family protein [Nocardia sp. NPDC088792]|uniref:flavin reductase family protein n=1 Tax=Nocardia sp. NPDC088792 TaxID=3364332 RepID=UPI00380B9BA1